MYLKRYEGVILCCDQALKIYPHGYAWMLRGDALAELGRYQEAIDSYNRAIDRALRIKPSDGEVWYNIARCYALQGNKEQAIENLQRAIELKPQRRAMAKIDYDFCSIWQDERFERLTQGR